MAASGRTIGGGGFSGTGQWCPVTETTAGEVQGGTKALQPTGVILMLF